MRLGTCVLGGAAVAAVMVLLGCGLPKQEPKTQAIANRLDMNVELYVRNVCWEWKKLSKDGAGKFPPIPEGREWYVKCNPGTTLESMLPDLRKQRIEGLSVTDPTVSQLKLVQTLDSLRVLDVAAKTLSEEELDAICAMRNLRSLRMLQTSISDAGVKKLCGLPNLESLDLGFSNIADASLEPLKAAGKLRWLGLEGCDITDAGIRELAATGRLTGLDLHDTRITRDGIRALRKMPLEFLCLTRLDVDDALMAELSTMKQLRCLWLYGNRLTDTGAEKLAELRGLVGLDLGGSQITDRAVDTLSRLPNLRYLYLADSELTERGLTKLRENTKIGFICVCGSKVTLDELAAFHKQMPACEICDEPRWKLPFAVTIEGNFKISIAAFSPRLADAPEISEVPEGKITRLALDGVDVKLADSGNTASGTLKTERFGDFLVVHIAGKYTLYGSFMQIMRLQAEREVGASTRP